MGLMTTTITTTSTRKAEMVPKEVTKWQPAEGEMLKGWKLGKKIGFGSFGTVYAAFKCETKQNGAIKFEDRTIDVQNRRLMVELAIMKHLIQKDVKYCVTYLSYGRMQLFNYIIMPLLGPNLKELMTRVRDHRINHTGLLSHCTIAHIGLKSLKAIHELHSLHYIHRDIKPDNFALDNDSNNDHVYLIDFGTARRYAHPLGQHRRPRAMAAFRGTYLYASINALRENEQSRRDDLWSWFYMLLLFYSGKLPWTNLEIPAHFKPKDVLDLFANQKEAFNNDLTLSIAPYPTSLCKIIKRLMIYNHYRQPEYDYFAELMRTDTKRFRLEGKSTTLDWQKRAYKKLYP